MPVIEDIQLSSKTRIIVWEIKETSDFLKSELDLSDLSKKTLRKKKSEIHQKQFFVTGFTIRRPMNSHSSVR